jgi:hypothetical protein
MASEAGPSLSLTVQPSTVKGRTAYTSAALGLAATFHREFWCCNNDLQRRKVCQSYRDRILSISQLADVTAAALNDAFPQSLRESSRAEDARAWTSFARLVQLQIIISLVDGGKLQTSPHAEHKKPTYSIGGTPIREHGLKRDRFSMIVPDGAPGVVRKSSSPSRRATKRRRVGAVNNEDSVEPEELQVPMSWHQTGPSSTYGSESEMTEFEEESSSGSVSASTGSDPQTPVGEDGLRSNTNDAESVTAEASVRETPNPSTPSPLESAYATRSEASGPKISSLQTNSTSMETRIENNEGHVHVAVADFESTPLRGPVESSDQESGSRNEDETSTFDTECLYKNLQEDSVSLDKESDHFLSDVIDRSYEAISAGENCHPRVLHGKEPPALQSPEVTIPDQQGDVLDEGIQTGNESEAEFTNYDDIAALELMVLMGEQNESVLPKECSGQDQDSQPASSHPSMSEGMMPMSEAFSLPTANGRFVPASTEGPKARYCTDTDADDDDTIVGRMASSYAERLREILDTARKHHDDDSIQEQNEIKVEWLEKTQWANVHAAPNDLNPNYQLPLDADVWYMDWETFQRRAEGGEVFRKPVVVKQTFQDSGMYEPHDYMALLRERYPGQNLDMQNSETGECVSESITDLLATRAESEGANIEESTASNNAINLKKDR